MVTGWRRAFCTSIPKDRAPKPSSSTQQHCDDHDIDNNNHRSPKISSKFGFFSSNSNPSTPRLQSRPVASPGLRCRTSTTQTSASRPNSPKLHCHVSNSVASSPKSPSAFSLLKLRVLSKTRCGICVQSVKSGQGTPIFTAECSHSFHFPCITTHLNTSAQLLLCPVCSAAWNHLPLLSLHHRPHHEPSRLAGEAKSPAAVKTFRVYDDDEPLMSPTAGAGFNPIPEEGDEETAVAGVEFQGFFVTKTPRLFECNGGAGGVEVTLLPEAAIVAAGRRYETYAVVMKVRATAMMNPTRRSPVDLVAVIDVGTAAAGIQTAKRAMRLIVSSLGSSDRLSVVAFSSLSKRLLPLRRMTAAGKRSARRIADALGAVAAAEKGISVGDAVKKAAKILEDRREKNPVATIVLLSDSGLPTASAGKFTVRTVGLAGSDSDALARRVTALIRVAARDVNLQLSFASGSAPAEIAAVYSLAKRPAAVGPGPIRLGDFDAEEEREFLVEIRVPTCSAGSHHVLSVRSSHRDPSSTEFIHSGDHPLHVPRPQAVRSSPSIERLRNLHVATRAVAESRLLADRGDLSGAHHLLSSARALLAHSKSASADEFSRGLEAELSELQRLRSHQRPLRSSCYRTDDKSEPLTPTSAWRAAERLAKVAIMRKSMNRVSDLHGFENARF